MECPHWMEPPPHKSKEKKKELQKKIRQLRQKKKKVMKVTSNLGVSLCHTRDSGAGRSPPMQAPLSPIRLRGWDSFPQTPSKWGVGGRS